MIEPAAALGSEALGRIGADGIPVPGYERAALVPRILHLGVGGFHRAHLALYTHELAQAGGDWGIRGLGRLEGDQRMERTLAEQDYLYTLIERDSDGLVRRSSAASSDMRSRWTTPRRSRSGLPIRSSRFSR